MSNLTCLENLEAQGYAILPGLLKPDHVDYLRQDCADLLQQDGVKPHGVRNLCERSAGIRILAQEQMVGVMDEHLGEPMRLVRAILFDKVPGANWKVGWHQDRTIAVKDRVETKGYTAWTIKDGVHHVEPPEGLLRRMLTLRLHLDDCDAENGALEVFPELHRVGKVGAAEIQLAGKLGRASKLCEVRAGDGLLMRPLLPHRSASAVSPRHRRVVHLEYAPVDGLASSLEWALG